MPFFVNKRSWGAQMKKSRGVKTKKEAREHAEKRNNPSPFKRRKAAAKGKRGRSW